MDLLTLVLTAVGLSMDALAVAICKGLSIKRLSWRQMVKIGLYFGIFQAGMPMIGYFIGRYFSSLIEQYDHWIAFALLLFIGGKMIKESFEKDGPDCDEEADLSFKAMLPLAVATSIDALAVGVTFAFLRVNIFLSAGLIGIITFALSAVGVKIGNVFGTKFKSKAELAGGVILMLIGVKILLEHLGIM